MDTQADRETPPVAAGEPPGKRIRIPRLKKSPRERRGAGNRRGLFVSFVQAGTVQLLGTFRPSYHGEQRGGIGPGAYKPVFTGEEIGKALTIEKRKEKKEKREERR